MIQRRDDEIKDKNFFNKNYFNNNDNNNYNYNDKSKSKIKSKNKNMINICEIKVGKFIKTIQTNKKLIKYEDNKKIFKRKILNYIVDNKLDNGNRKEKDENKENFNLKNFYENFIMTKSLKNLRKLCNSKKSNENNSKKLNELFIKYQIFKDLQEQIISKISYNNKKLLKIYKNSISYIAKDLISKLTLYIKYLKFYFFYIFKEKIKKFTREELLKENNNHININIGFFLSNNNDCINNDKNKNPYNNFSFTSINASDKQILFPDNSIIIKDQNIEEKFTHTKKFWNYFFNNNLK
jgi:hypothetical protein